jgi:hypothetical protein
VETDPTGTSRARRKLARTPALGYWAASFSAFLVLAFVQWRQITTLAAGIDEAVGDRVGRPCSKQSILGRDEMMWILMMVIGLAAFAAMFGFTWACDRL